MFSEKKEIQMLIEDGGIVTITITTSYYKGDIKIGEEAWQQALEPIAVCMTTAEEFLDNYHLNILKAVWTDNVVSTYAKKQSLEAINSPLNLEKDLIEEEVKKEEETQE